MINIIMIILLLLVIIIMPTIMILLMKIIIIIQNNKIIEWCDEKDKNLQGIWKMGQTRMFMLVFLI